MKWMVFCFMVLMAVPAIAQDCNGLIPCESSWDIFMSDMVKKGSHYIVRDVLLREGDDNRIAFVNGGVCVFNKLNNIDVCYFGKLKIVRKNPEIFVPLEDESP